MLSDWFYEEVNDHCDEVVITDDHNLISDLIAKSEPDVILYLAISAALAASAPPDWNVAHVGCTMVSDAVIVSVTVSPLLASVGTAFDDTMLSAVATGAVTSTVTLELSVTVVKAAAPVLPAVSVYVALNVTGPSVSAPTVYAQVQVVPLPL